MSNEPHKRKEKKMYNDIPYKVYTQPGDSYISQVSTQNKIASEPKAKIKVLHLDHTETERKLSLSSAQSCKARHLKQLSKLMWGLVVSKACSSVPMLKQTKRSSRTMVTSTATKTTEPCKFINQEYHCQPQQHHETQVLKDQCDTHSHSTT